MIISKETQQHDVNTFCADLKLPVGTWPEFGRAVSEFQKQWSSRVNKRSENPTKRLSHEFLERHGEQFFKIGLPGFVWPRDYSQLVEGVTKIIRIYEKQQNERIEISDRKRSRNDSRENDPDTEHDRKHLRTAREFEPVDQNCEHILTVEGKASISSSSPATQTNAFATGQELESQSRTRSHIRDLIDGEDRQDEQSQPAPKNGLGVSLVRTIGDNNIIERPTITRMLSRSRSSSTASQNMMGSRQERHVRNTDVESIVLETRQKQKARTRETSIAGPDEAIVSLQYKDGQIRLSADQCANLLTSTILRIEHFRSEIYWARDDGREVDWLAKVTEVLEAIDRKIQSNLLP